MASEKEDIRSFREEILQGIPNKLPPPAQPIPSGANRAPRRIAALSAAERALALANALRYFPPDFHSELAPEFAAELEEFGHIYMYRFKPAYTIKARHIDDFPHRSRQAASIMLMLSNNLDEAVAQHPYELVTYGGNGCVFQNWAQYRLTMQYLAQMTDEQVLVLYSGHPLGLFPATSESPRAVVTNGMMIPNYSRPEHLDKFYALGVTQYGQMTAGSFMYIGPQGIVHGTTITLLNAGRMLGAKTEKPRLFVSSGLGGMSGAQARAGVIAGMVAVIAEVNAKAIEKRHSQGWVDEVHRDLEQLTARILRAQEERTPVSLAYQGNIVDLWEHLVKSGLHVDLGSDQTSLHNPYNGGYYPAGLSFEEAGRLMARDPLAFKIRVQESLRRHLAAIDELSARGMYFFDYGNAFLLECDRAGADIRVKDPKNPRAFRYPSYVQDIMGPLCFDYGFGPFRWVCTSCDPKDLEVTDEIATKVLEEMRNNPHMKREVLNQLDDNLGWIRSARQNRLVVGSQARILYSNAEGRIKIATAFNQAIASGKISAPVVLGRDHHDVSGTDSPFRETSNIYDGSSFTADMAVHNVIGDSFRGATWVSLHNGGGVGWGEVVNGGFGLLLDGSAESQKRLENMLFWDVNNGVARRSWARNPGAIAAIEEAMRVEPRLLVTKAHLADPALVEKALGNIE